VDLWFYVHREESISYAHCCLHFACRWNSSSLGSPVAKFVCLQISYRVMWTCLKLSKLYNVLDVDKSIIYVWWFYKWNFWLELFVTLLDNSPWKIGPFHSISVSLTVADYCSLAGVHLDFSEQAPFSEWSLPMAPRLISNATTYGSTLGIWTLQTLIWLLISPSWLLLIVHGIGNLTQTCLVHWLTELIRETSSACIHSIRGISQRTLEING